MIVKKQNLKEKTNSSIVWQVEALLVRLIDCRNASFDRWTNKSSRYTSSYIVKERLVLTQ